MARPPRGGARRAFDRVHVATRAARRDPELEWPQRRRRRRASAGAARRRRSAISTSEARRSVCAGRRADRRRAGRTAGRSTCRAGESTAASSSSASAASCACGSAERDGPVDGGPCGGLGSDPGQRRDRRPDRGGRARDRATAGSSAASRPCSRPASTVAITTMEYEPGGGARSAGAARAADPRTRATTSTTGLNHDTNAHAHLRAALIGPSESDAGGRRATRPRHLAADRPARLRRPAPAANVVCRPSSADGRAGAPRRTCAIALCSADGQRFDPAAPVCSSARRRYIDGSAPGTGIGSRACP